MLRIHLKRLFSTQSYLPTTPVWSIKDLKFDEIDEKESISQEQVLLFWYFGILLFYMYDSF